MFQKLSCDQFLGERLCVRAGTIGEAAWPVIGVTTLVSYGVLLAMFTVIGLCDLL
jgi:hypothetical protein